MTKDPEPQPQPSPEDLPPSYEESWPKKAETSETNTYDYTDQNGVGTDEPIKQDKSKRLKRKICIQLMLGIILVSL